MQKISLILRKLFTIPNILAICSVLFAIIKVKSLAFLLPLKESDNIFYWTYLFLIIPNFLSFGLSVEVYKLYLKHEGQTFNKLIHYYTPLIACGVVITSFLLLYFRPVPPISLLGIIALFSMMINLPLGSMDTLVGLVKGAKTQQILNLIRSNLWLVFFIPLILNNNYQDYLLLFFLSYFFSQIVALLLYKKALGHVGGFDFKKIKRILLNVKQPKFYTRLFNNILIQNKDYILGFSIRTFILLKLNGHGLILLLSVFDVLITIIISFVNNEFLKNYGKKNAHLKNMEWIKIVLVLTIVFLVIINLFNTKFIFLLVGNKSHNLDSYLLYFSIYAFLRIIFVSYNQLLLLEGLKLKLWMSALSFLYLIVLLKPVNPISAVNIFLGLLVMDIILVYTSFKKNQY